MGLWGKAALSCCFDEARSKKRGAQRGSLVQMGEATLSTPSSRLTLFFLAPPANRDAHLLWRCHCTASCVRTGARQEDPTLGVLYLQLRAHCGTRGSAATLSHLLQFPLLRGRQKQQLEEIKTTTSNSGGRTSTRSHKRKLSHTCA